MCWKSVEDHPYFDMLDYSVLHIACTKLSAEIRHTEQPKMFSGCQRIAIDSYH